jgi:hypothetical protein
MYTTNKTSTITLSDIIEGNNGVCDIKYKDKTLPVGLILELEAPAGIYPYNEEVHETFIDETFYNNLLLNEKRKQKQSHTRKRKPIKIKLSLKNKI